MKDLVLWKSAKAREKESRRLRDLAALHQSPEPPRELAQPLPRKLRWTRALKIDTGLKVLLLTFQLCAGLWLIRLTNDFYGGWVRETRQSNEKMRQYISRTIDSEKRIRLEKSLRLGEELDQMLSHLQHAAVAGIFFLMILLPITSLCLFFLLRVRPEKILLRQGMATRATVITKKNWLFVTFLKISFTTDRGELIEKRRLLNRKEAALFQNGSFLWILYLPSRPKRAMIYGLKGSLVEVITV